MRVAHWAYLLDEDEDFRRWFNNIARGSRVTAFENARILFRFLRHHNMTPRELAELAKKDREKVEDVLLDFVSELHEEGKAPKRALYASADYALYAVNRVLDGEIVVKAKTLGTEPSILVQRIIENGLKEIGKSEEKEIEQNILVEIT